MPALLMLLIIIQISYCSSPVPAAISHSGGSRGGRAFIFLIDGLDLKTIEAATTPHLDTLQERGAIGLMNTRSGGGSEPFSSYLSLGTGRRAEGFPLSPVDDEALTRLVELNREGDYGAVPGLLGEMLEQAGLGRMLLGSSGLEEDPALLLLMDREGGLPQILSTSRLATEEGFASELEEFRGMVVIESRQVVASLPAAATWDRAGELEAADYLLGELWKYLCPERDLLLVISPTPSSHVSRMRSNLTPLLAWGKGLEPGIITSPTTRRKGIVTNLDLAPTLLSFFGLEESPLFPGRTLASLPDEVDWSWLQELHTGIINTASWRPVVIKVFVFSQIMVLALFLINLLFSSSWLRTLLDYLILALFLVPSGLLLISLIPVFTLEFLSLVLLIYLLLGTLFLSYFISTPHHRLAALCWITVLLIISDLALGAPLNKSSILGYDPIIGARFYGLGNEYMGILVGATLMGVVIIHALIFKEKDRETLLVPALIYLLVTLFLSLPFLGANLGGALTAFFTFTISILYLRGSLSLRDLFTCTLMTLAGLSFILLVESILSPYLQSHIGRTLGLVGEEGIMELFRIAARKLGMNLKLLRWTVWTRVLLSFIVVLFIVFKRPLGRMQQVLSEYPFLGSGFRAALWGGVITMVVNDSGVVAMATLLFFPIFTLLYLVLNWSAD